MAEQTAVFEQANATLKAAKSILVIGGGPIGIEMAGEIMEEMPGKTVTLVTSKELMPSPTVAFPDKFRTRLRKKLEAVRNTSRFFTPATTRSSFVLSALRTHCPISLISLRSPVFSCHVNFSSVNHAFIHAESTTTVTVPPPNIPRK